MSERDTRLNPADVAERAPFADEFGAWDEPIKAPTNYGEHGGTAQPRQDWLTSQHWRWATRRAVALWIHHKDLQDPPEEDAIDELPHLSPDLDN